MEDQSAPQPPLGCPAHREQPRGPLPLYDLEFAARPDTFYQELREQGPAARVEVAPGVEAVLVTEYATALRVLQTPGLFAKDSRRWRALSEGHVPEDSPALAMMAYRPNCMFTDGAEHARLRRAVTDSLDNIDPHQLSRQVGQVADYLIDQFGHLGKVDLLDDYAKALPLLVFNQLFGCSAGVGDRIMQGTSAIFDGVDTKAAAAQLAEGLSALVTDKRAHPDQDVTSWLMAHEAGLDDSEMVYQLELLMGAGTEPLRNLIANSLRLLLSDEKYANGGFGGGLLVDDAIDDVLWNAPPLANFSAHYPVEDTDLDGIPVQAGEPVLISFAAANTDPALDSSRQLLSRRAHLAWSAGPHACPGKDRARLITVTAIEKLLNRIPDIELAVPLEQLTWRPGPFHRALESLPARFAPVRREPLPASPGAPAQQDDILAHAPRKSRWSAFLDWLGV